MLTLCWIQMHIPYQQEVLAFIFIFQKMVFLWPPSLKWHHKQTKIMFQFTKFNLSDRIYPIGYTYIRIEDIPRPRQILRAVKGRAIWWDKKPCSFMPANDSNTNHVITILIHSDKTHFQNVFVTLLRTWRRRCFYGINAMILMLQIFDVTANENMRYKCNELEFKTSG